MSKAAFPGDRRLRNPGEFKRVFAKGRRQHDAFFTVVSVHNELSRPRVGLTVSKRVARLAVQRNRIKRLVRESFRIQQSDMPAVDIVVMAKSQAKDVDNQTLTNSLAKHWHRLTH